MTSEILLCRWLDSNQVLIACSSVGRARARKNADAIATLVKGDLKSFDTWETELTKAAREQPQKKKRLTSKKRYG